jgi:hypothetical protein
MTGILGEETGLLVLRCLVLAIILFPIHLLQYPYPHPSQAASHPSAAALRHSFVATWLYVVGNCIGGTTKLKLVTNFDKLRN